MSLVELTPVIPSRLLLSAFGFIFKDFSTYCLDWQPSEYNIILYFLHIKIK